MTETDEDRRRASASRSGRWFAVAFGALVVAVAAMAVMGYLSGRSSGSGGEVECSSGVRIDGRFFEEEGPNEGVLDASSLGEVVAVVERSRGCANRDGDASQLPVGTEVRAVAGVDPGVGVAAVDGRIVRFYRAWRPNGSQSVEQLLLDDITEAHLLAPFDPRYRMTQLDAPTTERLVADLMRSQRVPPEYRDGVRDYVVEFVRRDGLTTMVSLDLGRRVASSVFAISEASASAVSEALDGLPPRAEADGLLLTGSSGTVPIRPLSGCLPDRPELMVRPGEQLTIAGARAGSITFVFVTGEGIEPFGRSGSDFDGTIEVPEGSGPISIELSSASAQFCVIATIAE